MATQIQSPRSNLPLQLAGANRVWQAARARRFLAGSLKWLILLILLTVAADLVFQLPSWMRLTGTGLMLLAIVGVLGATFWIALVSESPLERIARLLETRAPNLGSKLINMIQLQKQIEDPSLPISTRSLARRAVEQVDKDLSSFQLREIAQTPLPREQILGAILPVGGVLLLGLVFFKITTNQVMRFVDPFGDHPPFAFTTLAILTPGDDSQRVIYKKNAIIEVAWSGHDPKDVYLTSWDPANQGATTRTTPMIRKERETFVQNLENVTTDLVVVAHNKDRRALSPQRKIGVVLTPQIAESKVEIALPAYTRAKPREIPYHYKTLQTLTNSQLTFSIISNRPLAGGEIKVTSTDGETSLIAMIPSTEQPEKVVGSIMARGSAKLDFKVTDIAGIPSDGVLSGGITVTNDLAPTIRIIEPFSDSFIVISHELNAEIEIADDHGISQMRLHRALNQNYSTPVTFSLADQPKQHRQTVPFHLPKLGVEPGDVISFFAEAIDNAPIPQLTRSETRHLLVISEEEYNEEMRTQTDLSMVQEKFETLTEKLDELAAQQEKIAEELKKLNDPANSESDEDKQKKLDELLAKQSELNDSIEKQAGAMEQFTRENPLYDIEKSLQEKLNERAGELRDSVQANRLASEEAKAKRDAPSAEQAAREQLEKMKGTRQEQEETVNKPLQEMAELHELMNDFNHFKELYQQQKNIAEQSQPYKSGRALTNEDRLALQSLASQEEEIRQQLQELSEKLKQDAAAASETFPKAAQSASKLAEKMDQARLPELAGETSSSMLKGKGGESAERAERLRREMEDLMKGCQGCQNGGEMSDELDQFLSLSGMSPGNTFGQMMQSRLFGQGQGQGGMGGQGMGAGGTGGFGTTQSPNMGMLGGESHLGNHSGGKGNSRKNGPGTPGQSASSEQFGKTDTMPEIKPATRESTAVTPEILAEQYRGIVEEYFRALTRPKAVKPQTPITKP